MLKIALTGLPCAGKSTTGGIVARQLEHRGMRSGVLKLAKPLYDVQDFFYRRCSVPLGSSQQDGILLNFLGSHFRQVSAGFLIDDLDARCELAQSAGLSAVICDDARPADLLSLRERGFTLVSIRASPSVRSARRLGRGDRFQGRDDHPTEVPLDADVLEFDHVIDNNAGLEELERAAMIVVEAAALKLEAPVEVVEGSAAIQALFDCAKDAITSTYRENRHQIGAALLMSDGRVFTGIHIEAMVGRASICAEAVALGKAREAGSFDVRMIASVRHPKPSEQNRSVRIVPPCGLCRELLLDYGSRPRVVLEIDGKLRSTALAEMLPHKYVGTKWLNEVHSGGGSP